MSFSIASRQVTSSSNILLSKNQFPLTQNKQNSSSRSSSAHNKNRRQISASNSKTIDLGFSSINYPNEINVWNSHKHSTNHFTDLNGKPITYDHNQHTHSPRQYSPIPEVARISHHSSSSSGRNFLLSKKSAPIYQHFPNDTNSSSNWQNEFDKADLKRNSNELTYQDFDQIGSNAKLKSNADRDKYSDRGAGSRQNSRFHGGNYFSTNSADIYGTMPEWNNDYQSRNSDWHSELDRHERGIERFEEEIEDLGIRSNKSERKNGRLQEELDDCKEKLKLSQERNLQLENENEIFILQMKNSNNSNEKLKSEFKILQNQTNQYLARINQLQSALKESKGINGRLQQDFDDCKVKLNHSQRRNSQLESANYFKSQIGTNQCANCAESTRQLQNQKSRVKKKIEELAKDFQLKMENSKSSIEKLKSELNKSVNKCKSLQNENDSNKSQFSRQIWKLELIIKEINEERQILQSNYNKSGEENENLKFQCDKYLAEINKLESVLKESDRTNSRLQQEFDAKSKHSDGNSQLESANLFKSQMDRNRFENNAELIKQLENEKETDKRKVEEITKDFQLKIENLNRSIEKMLLELSQSENKFKSLQNDNNNIKSRFAAQVEQLQLALKESDRTMGSLQRDFEDCKEKLKHSQERNLQLENEMAVNKRTIEEITKDFQLKMEDSNSSNEKMLLELNRSEDKCKSLQNENDNDKSHFSGQIGKLESIIKQINEERQILQNKYDECKLIFNQSNHEEQILQWQTEMKNLTTKYDKLQSDRDNLKLLVKEIDDKNKILQNNYNKSDKENENLKFQCDKYLAEINKLESVLKESDRTNRRLQQEFEAKSKHSERNSQLESANLFKSQMDRNRFENNSELIKQLQNENVRVKSKIEEITKDFQLKMENSNRSIEKLKLECRNLQNANDQLESTIKEIDKGKQILQKKYDDVKRHSIQPERDLVRLQQSVEELRNELEYWKSKSNGNPQNRNDEFQAQIKRDKKEIQSPLNSRINTKKIHSKANEKSNYPHESNQTKSEAPIKINYSEDHNKRFMKENDNLERIESNSIGRSRSNLKVERRDRSFGSESNMSNVTPYNHQNNNILRDPIGFENPKGFCFLNCVIQQLYSCTEFKDDLIQYHRGDSIATDQSNPQASDDDKIFVNNFSKLMEEIDNRNDRKIRELVSEIQKYFIESSSGDDVLKCFMTVLTILSNVTKVKILNRNNSIQYINPEVSFENFKNQNNGFVFKSFYGQMALRLVCVHCKYSVNTSYQLFKSVALPVPETRSTIRLDEIINGFLQESPVEMDDKRDCKCPNGSLNFLSITEYTHMPRYLHIYLNRGSFYKNGLKNNTHVTCGQVLNFPMKDTSLKYKLISVIDHIGDTLGGHYYAKSCFETDQWWMLNDSTVYRIYGDEKIATENTIVFLFKKFT